MKVVLKGCMESILCKSSVEVELLLYSLVRSPLQRTTQLYARIIGSNGFASMLRCSRWVVRVLSSLKDRPRPPAASCCCAYESTQASRPLQREPHEEQSRDPPLSYLLYGIARVGGWEYEDITRDPPPIGRFMNVMIPGDLSSLE
jgi:hypothetical protein